MTLKPVRMHPDGDPGNGFAPSSLVAEQDFTTDDNSELICEFFATEDQGVSAGIWECAPCKELFEAYPVNKMMTVVSGSVTLSSPDGTVQTFTQGDSFFMPKGTACTWEVTETLRKFYMISA